MDTQRPELHWFPFHDDVENFDIMQPCVEVENEDETGTEYNSEICHVQSLIDGLFYDVNSLNIFRLLNPTVIEGSITNLSLIHETKMTKSDL